MSSASVNLSITGRPHIVHESAFSSSPKIIPVDQLFLTIAGWQGDVEQAKHRMALVKKNRHYPPNLFTYASYLKAFIKAEKYDEGKEAYFEMSKFKLKPDEKLKKLYQKIISRLGGNKEGTNLGTTKVSDFILSHLDKRLKVLSSADYPRGYSHASLLAESVELFIFMMTNQLKPPAQTCERLYKFVSLESELKNTSQTLFDYMVSQNFCKPENKKDEKEPEKAVSTPPVLNDKKGADSEGNSVQHVIHGLVLAGLFSEASYLMYQLITRPQFVHEGDEDHLDGKSITYGLTFLIIRNHLKTYPSANLMKITMSSEMEKLATLIKNNYPFLPIESRESELILYLKKAIDDTPSTI